MLRAVAGGSPEGSRAAVSSPAGSVLPMGATYQLALQLLLDTMASMYQRDHNISEESMKLQQSNLE